MILSLMKYTLPGLPKLHRDVLIAYFCLEQELEKHEQRTALEILVPAKNNELRWNDTFSIHHRGMKGGRLVEWDRKPARNECFTEKKSSLLCK